MRKRTKKVVRPSPIALGLIYKIAGLPLINIVVLVSALTIALIVFVFSAVWINKFSDKSILEIMNAFFSGKAELELAKQGIQKSPPTNDRPNADDSESDS